MSRKARKRVKNIWSLGSNAFYTLHRTLLNSHEYFISTDWVFLSRSFWLLSLAATSDVMSWSAICPALSKGWATDCMWWWVWTSSQYNSKALSPFQMSHFSENSGNWKNTLILLHLITGTEAKMLLSSWGNCKPPNHPKLRNAHRIFYYSNLQTCLLSRI